MPGTWVVLWPRTRPAAREELRLAVAADLDELDEEARAVLVLIENRLLKKSVLGEGGRFMR
jgi:hypothetical protein